MTLYAKSFASYLARTFYPVTVSFVSKPIVYSNQLFSIKHKISNSINDLDYIYFNLSLNKYLFTKSHNFNTNNKLNTPESFIKYMLDRPSKYTMFTLIKESDNSDLVKFDTNGMIPIRYLDILNDFSLNKFTYKKPTEKQIMKYENEILEKIYNVSDSVFYDIFTYASFISSCEKTIKIEVIKAPQYTHYIQGNNIKYYRNSWRSPININKATELIKNRYWCSSDGDLSSPSTKIFIKKSSKLLSLNNIGYNVLYSLSGGINLTYLKTLPFTKLKQTFNDKYVYNVISGENTYYSSYDNIDLTEFIILTEFLAKEKADYIVEYN